MNITLLIDLDDTLLGNDIDSFLPVYLKALAGHMSAYVAPELMVSQLLAATQIMSQNDSAEKTLENAFDQAFYPAIGRTKTELLPVIEQFYDEVFPGLQYLTQTRPEAVRIVSDALQQGHQVVIATNPLFPRKAILHRLKWAGLDPDRYEFSIITTFERFHFAKPNPAYIAEILAQLGWPSQPAVMIGNSIKEDLLPAAQLGLPGFWVTTQPNGLPEGLHPRSASGTLMDIPAWLDTISTYAPRQEAPTAQELLAQLKSTPAAIDTLCKDLKDQQWHQRPAADQWNITEIICHMRDVDREVNIPRFEAIIAGRNPFVPGINTDTWALERDYNSENGPAALQEFIHVRSLLVPMLNKLSPKDWQQPARHAIFGPTHLAELVSFVTTHDCSHIQSILSAIQSTQNAV